ncbi:major capsid protein [Prescottella equi]|uniref:major capsid protein n=1 Tax=Rhodococcus hoagii TaxID=43767 RepID=UPI000A102081|nr:major capsid protein [Prescottella equi]ORL98830.1 hypothetical protein A5N72_22365 [Prescottella equi]
MSTSFLTPQLNGGMLTVEAALQQPTRITKRLADLVAPRALAGQFFSADGQKVEGGGILYSALRPSDLYADAPEDRGPGTEYRIVATPEARFDLAELEDFGGKFEVTDEEKLRNQAHVVDQRTTQLANSILRSLDTRALAAVDAAIDGLDGGVGVVPGSNWSAIERNGDPTAQTPTADRFEADLAAVQLAFDVDDLGLTFDTLVMNPTQKAAVTTAYGKDLADVLAAFETKIVTSNLVPSGQAYAVSQGGVGTIGYELPLTTEIIPRRERRSTVVQSYVVPAFAPHNPYAVKKITGLAG